MENFAIIQAKDLEELYAKINEIHEYVKRESFSPVRKLKEGYLTSNDAAQVLRCSVRSIHNYINQGLLPRRVHKHRLYFLSEDLETFMKGKYGYNFNQLTTHKLYKNE